MQKGVSVRDGKRQGLGMTSVTRRPNKDVHGARRFVPGEPHASYPLDLIALVCLKFVLLSVLPCT